MASRLRASDKAEEILAGNRRTDDLRDELKKAAETLPHILGITDDGFSKTKGLFVPKDVAESMNAGATPAQAATLRVISRSLHDLKSQKPDEIFESMKLLSALQIRDCIPQVIGHLSHRDPLVREQAITSLAEYGTSEALDALAKRLGEVDAEAFENWGETQLICRGIVSIDYEKGLQRLLEVYRSGPNAVLRQIYNTLLSMVIKPSAVHLFRECIEDLGGDNQKSLPLLLLVGIGGEGGDELIADVSSRLEPGKAKMIADLSAMVSVGNPTRRRILDEFKENPSIFGPMSYIAVRTLGHQALRDPKLADELTPVFEGCFRNPSNPLEKMEAALALGALGRREVVPFLNEKANRRDPFYFERVRDVLFGLKDVSSVPFFSSIALNKSGREDSLSRVTAEYVLSELQTPEALDVLGKLSSDPDMDVRESATRFLHRFRVMKAGVPLVELAGLHELVPCVVWVPARIAAEDRHRKAELKELLESRILLSWREGVKRLPKWGGWVNEAGIPTRDLYFAPMRDPSYVLVKDGEAYPPHTSRSLLTKVGGVSYTIKRSGANYPYIKGNLLLPYHYEQDVWLYGGKLIPPQGGPEDREVDTARRVDEALVRLFRDDPILKAAHERYGVDISLFLKPMLKVEPLYMPVGLFGVSKPGEAGLKQGFLHKPGEPVAYLPIKDGLRLADVPDDELDDKLQLYIYRNSTGEDERLAGLTSHLADKSRWGKYLDSSGVGGLLERMGARFASFIYVTDGLLRIGCDRKSGDTFTFQNVNPMVVFDWETLSAGGSTEENMRRQMVNALYLLDTAAQKLNASKEEIERGHRVFRDILTGEILQGR